MDSFYDAPRRPPQPVSREALLGTLLVPDISVLSPSNVPRNTFASYNQWKMQHTEPSVSNKENFNASPQNISILKKQVRFESPVFQPNLIKSGESVERSSYSVKETGKSVSNFEQVYMANIPNRKLDLSVIELPKKKGLVGITSEENQGNIHNKFLSTKKNDQEIILNDSVMDIFNYKKSDSPQQRPFQGLCDSELLQSKNNLTKLRLSNNSETQQTNPVYEEIFCGNGNTSNSFKRIIQEVPKVREIGDYCRKTPLNVKNIVPTEFNVKNQVPDNTVCFGNSENKKKCECSDKMFKAIDSPKSNVPKLNAENDVSIKDLLKIISQQNEQILLLQKQVSTLICREDEKQNNVKSIEYDQGKCNRQGVEKNYIGHLVEEKCITSTRNEKADSVREEFNTPRKRKNKLPNFSIGVMTSFEVSVRQPQKNQGWQFNTYKNEEIPEMDNNKSAADMSIVFKEPIKVREQCPSPEPSIKISMNDFEDSDCDDDSFSNVGSSFYPNLMAQVNKILKKAQIEAHDEIGYVFNEPNSEVVTNKLNRNTKRLAKEATLKHLRSIGVEVPAFDDSSSSSSSDEIGSKSYNQEDVSFTVKQLLMKYLPDDHLASVKGISAQQNPEILTRKEKAGVIKNRPEFSFATVQYMKKYNLITNCPKDLNPPAREKLGDAPKILDITKLKQQPKLL